MSHLVNNLLSRSRLLKTAAIGVVLGFSVATQAANVDAPVAQANAGVSVAQAQTFDTLAGLDATPLNASEVETFDGARFKWPQWIFPKPKPLPLPFPKPPTCKRGPTHYAAMVCR